VKNIQKFGGKTIGLLLILTCVLIATIISFVMKFLNLPVFIFLLLGSLVFMFLVIIDRNKSFIKEKENLMKKAEECIQKSEWKNAIVYFDKVLFLEEDNYGAMMGKGYCFRAKTNYKSAISQYKNVIKIKKDYTEAYFLLGVCYFEERFLKESMDSFKKVVSLDPGYMEAYLFMGDLHRFQGERKQAREYYLKYLEKCDNEKIRNDVLDKLESVKEIDEVEDSV